MADEKQMANPPLERHVGLQPLSRDHYVGLVRAQALIRSARETPADRRTALAGFLDAWDKDIQAHFADEERLLTGLMSPGDAERLNREHAALRALAAEAPGRQREEDPDSGWVERLGRTLNDHIRWEERELFPAIERSATPEQLAELTREAELIEAARQRSIGGGPRPKGPG